MTSAKEQTKYHISDQIKSLMDEATSGENKYISYDELKKVHQNAHTKRSLLYYISTTRPLLSQEQIEPRPAKTAEYTTLMAKLRQEEAERQYQSYLNQPEGEDNFVIDTIGGYKKSQTQSNAKAIKETNHHLTTIFNILITVGSVFYAVWYWTGSSTYFNDAYRVLLSLFFSVVVLIAEVVVFGGYLRKVEEARKVERSKREVKTIISSYHTNSNPGTVNAKEKTGKSARPTESARQRQRSIK